MKKTDKIKIVLLKTLDFLFPSLMHLIWSTYFWDYCYKQGYAVFTANSEQEALDYLVK